MRLGTVKRRRHLLQFDPPGGRHLRDGKQIIPHKWVHFAERGAVPNGWPIPPEPAPGEVMPYRVLVEIEGRPSLKVDMVYTDVEDGFSSLRRPSRSPRFRKSLRRSWRPG